MDENFLKAMEFVFSWEGGYVDDPADPGGRTRWGISQRAYPDLDIANLTKDQARAIYKKDYWDKVGGDTLPAPLALVAFNAAVNCGVGRAKRWLGGCGGEYKEFLRMQITHYINLRNSRFIHGWIARTIAAWVEARKLEVT